MNQWQTGAQANGMFPQSSPGHLNPAAMYNNTNIGTPSQFDVNGGQFQQSMPNGGTATPTPAFNNQTFQPGSVVPAKRPHDGMSGSPQQSHASRSQTPNYGGFANQQAAGQQFANAPTPYQHLRQPGSTNATPSPTIAHQQFRPPTQQSRMQNASPSPFPQAQGNFGNQMSPGVSQQNNLPTSVSQQNPMVGWNSGMTTNAGMSMSGMPNSMPTQLNNMAGMQQQQNNAHRAYQMKLMQHQAQLRNSGMIPPRAVGGQPSGMNHFGGQQPGATQTPNGQSASQMAMQANQQHQNKRNAFLKTLAGNLQAQGKPFNPTPMIGGRPVDLYMLWTLTTQMGGSRTVDQSGQWQAVANKLGFAQPQFPNAGEQLKLLHAENISQYERLWFAMRAQQKQEQARVHAHQMAGLGGPTQASPTRTMQPPNPQHPYNQYQQNQQVQQPPQTTPVQPNAQLPPNGMSTPQQMMQHRRNSSVRRPEAMTPQAGTLAVTAPSPHSAPKVQRSPSIKQDPGAPVMKSEEPQSTNYVPHMRTIEYDGGYDVAALYELGTTISRAWPNMPTVDEMGVIDTKAISLSLASGIHAEVRYALDALAVVSRDDRVAFDLEKCEDLLDIIVDCAEEQTDTLSEEAVEVSDALDLPSYEDIMRGTRNEAETLQDVPEFGTQEYTLDRAADRLIAITTVLRNLSFYEHNHRLLTSTSLVKWLSNTIRLLGTRNMLLRTFYNALDFYKDMITFLSNITQSLELPTRDDALHILHFLLAFAPQPAPNYGGSGRKIRFTSFVPAVHRFLPPAVDCLAKLLARQDPNRMLYRSIFTASSSSLALSESPLDLLTRAFALSISVLPDRSKGTSGNVTQLRIVEARKAYLTQGMLAADILTSLAPSNDPELGRAWIESDDGWAVGLLNLVAILSVDRSQNPAGPKGRELGADTEIYKLITHRALAMMKRLAEKAGKGSITNGLANGSRINGEETRHNDDDGDTMFGALPKWEGIPQGHAILGALMMPTTDKVALGLLCGLHEMAMQT